MESKKCTKCGGVKYLSAFSKKSAWCKCCVAVYKKSYNEANKEKIKEKDKAYREANKEKIKERKKAYYEANKQNVKANNKIYREANKEKIKEIEKAYREANKEKIKAQRKNYREANKEIIKQKVRKQRKRDVDNLTDTYICRIIGISKVICPPELIEAKRAQLKLLRLCNGSL